MIEKVLNLFFKDDDLDHIYNDERFMITNEKTIIDKKSQKVYFELNPLRYKLMGTWIIDKITDKRVIRKIEYSRYELMNENKILDNAKNKEYDNLEDIVLLLNSQNQFIDKTKDVIDEEIQITNRNERYASELGDEEEVKMNNEQRKLLKRIQKKLFPK